MARDLQPCVHIADGESGGKKTKYEEGLRCRLVLDIIGNGVGDKEPARGQYWPVFLAIPSNKWIESDGCCAFMCMITLS